MKLHIHQSILDKYLSIRQSLVNNKLTELLIRSNTTKQCLPTINYLNEYQILNLDFGRQTGSSFFINDFIQSNKYSKILINFYNLSTLNRFKQQYFKDEYLQNIDLITNPRLLDDCVRGMDYEFIVLDTSCLYKYQSKKNFYKTISCLNNLKLVLEM